MNGPVGWAGLVVSLLLVAVAATATTTVVIALGLIRRLFTPDHRLVHLATAADR